MAAASTSSIVFLLVFLVTMDSATMAFSEHCSVRIYNKMPATELVPIQVHCRKAKFDKKEVIPWTTLQSGQPVGVHVEWGFKPNFWGTTLYQCDFKWGAKIQSFDVWYDALMWWLLFPCCNCEWYVAEDGFTEFEADVFHDGAIERYSWK